MRVLVTGAAGYIGSMLCQWLLSDDYEVTAVDNFLHGGQSLAHHCCYDRFNPVRGDARDERLMKELVSDADIIIPLAAIVGMPACDRDEVATITTNRDAITMLCHLASPSQLICYPNTNSGYGSQPGLVCTEDMPLTPISLYGRMKCEAEEIVMERDNSIGFRLATVFGCSFRMRTDLLVNDFVYRAVTDRSIVLFESNFRRNYVHVQDVANAFLYAIENDGAMKGNIYNVGDTNANMTKWDLAALIKSMVDDVTLVNSEGQADLDKRDYEVSNAKMEATGWRPMYTMMEGINELIKFYRTVSVKRFSNV